MNDLLTYLTPMQIGVIYESLRCEATLYHITDRKTAEVTERILQKANEVKKYIEGDIGWDCYVMDYQSICKSIAKQIS